MAIPEGHIKDMFVRWADRYDARPVDEKQLELTDRILVPELGAIEAELLELRKAFDVRILQALKDDPPKFPKKLLKDPSIRNHFTYPVGYCAAIRDGMFEDVSAQLHCPSTPGISAISRFVGEGGCLKKVGGIQHRQFFQNGIQAGALWLDAANNTVDVDSPPVKISVLANSGFQNIDDFSLCGDVIESYWKSDVYPQRVFPYLSPLFPIIYVSSGGRVHVLPINISGIANNVFSDFKMAEDFMFRSRFAGKRLPAKQMNRIKRKYPGANKSENPFEHLNPDDSVIAASFECFRSLNPNELFSRVEKAIDLTKGINDALENIPKI
ncbi:MAG: hypothetical protein Q8P62_03930 [Candidatus Peregrinibacteria bacterium]|nr:hypothetical protein [Candidatus Peregrinibacteria bacterium]